MRYIIGIDCGASCTEVLIYPIDISLKTGTGKIKPLKFDAINYNLIGLDKTVKRLTAIIKKSASKIKVRFTNIGYISAGISGARNEKDRGKIRQNLQKELKFKNITIYPDTEVAFAAAFEPQEKNCGILIAGTGSVLYYKNSKGKIIRTGGWGRYIGDEGSGYWIARTALHKLTQHYDRRERKTSLAGKILKYGITEGNIINKIYHKNFEISKITVIVFECAESGDKVCKEIIKQAAELLSLHFVSLKNVKAQIALFGSLFSEEMLLEYYLKKITKQKYPNIKLIKNEHKPVWGAVKLGLGTVNAG